MAADLMAHNHKGLYRHMHGYGQHGRELFPQFKHERKVDLSKKEWVRAAENITAMDACLAAADLVICSSGAITLSELQAAGKASILVPSPYVAENHQYHNAMQLQKLGAAVVAEEKNLTGEGLIRIVDELTSDPAQLMVMGAKARKLAQPDSLEMIYHELEKLMEGDS